MATQESWQKKEVRHVGEVVTGTTPSTKKPEYYGDEYKLISPADLDNGKYVTTSHRMLSPLGLGQCRVLPRDSVLVGCIGNVGKIGMVADEKAATNQQINAVICNQDHDPHFVYYSLFYNRQAFEKAAVKTTVPILNKSNFEKFEIEVPLFPEQRRIAHVLGTVQTTIEQQTRLIALTRELKRALMRKLFTQGLRGEKQKQTEIGLVPESWEVKPLGSMTTAIDYGTSVKCHYTKDGFPVLRIPNVVGGSMDFHDLKYGQPKKNEIGIRVLAKGDLLFVRTNGVQENAGRCSIFNDEMEDCYFASYLIRVRLDYTQLVPDFLNEYTRTEVGKSSLSGKAARTADGKFNINSGTIRSLLVPVPKTDEQEAIAIQLALLEQKSNLHIQRQSLLQELFRTLLHQLMTGQIRVDDLDVPGLS